MITDPYKVLNVGPDASDDEIKKAYRELARKYHPDHYHGSPLEEMAEEKMKEINEAYAMIQKQRKGGGQQPYGASSGYGGYGQDQQSGSSNPVFQRIRMAINRGDLNEAERLLQQTDLRTAEWHYLMGRLYYHRGWLDDAAQEFEMACGMDPNNPEYQQAYQYMRAGGGAYRPEGYGTGGIMQCNWCQAMICASCACTFCTGGRVYFCC